MRQSRNIAGLVCTLFFSTLLNAANIDLSNSTSVKAAIDSQGAQTIINNIWKNPLLKGQLLQNISAGDDSWLVISTSLVQDSTVNQRFLLTQAIGNALPNNPQGVLKLIGQGFEFDDLCAVPLVEPTQEETYKFALKAEQAMLAASDAVTETHRQRCLSLMQTIKLHSQ